MLLRNAKILNSDFEFEFSDIEISNGKIIKILPQNEKKQEEATDLSGCTIIPGLIDVHIHGCNGIDTMENNFEALSVYLAKNGITSFLPTTMTLPVSELKNTLSTSTRVSGAQILGFHLEGPYVSSAYKGAQNEKYIKEPDINDFEGFDNIKMITIAPEINGAMEFIKEASKKYSVSLGHTETNYETAIEAIENGANCVTHLFNAMKAFSHREPNLLGAAFEKNIYTQIICDGIHVHKAAVNMAYRLFSENRLVLISDALSPCGLADGTYDLGKQTVTVENGIAKLSDGTIAGSTSNLFECVKTAVKFGIPFEKAVKMASKNPADLIGENKKGRIKVGYDADLVVLDSDLNVANTYVKGILKA